MAPQQCQSQNTVSQLDAQACYATTDAHGNIQQYEMCAPSSISPANYACSGGLAPGASSVPACQSSIGTMAFSVGNSTVASIDSTTNLITAKQPGTTVITASIAGSGSSAGYFSTCPPASIIVALANGKTTGTVTQGVSQNLTTTVYDTNNQTITGLSLEYQSTNPIDVTASSGGAIATNYPGVASVNAICLPNSCNPAPTNVVGTNGTGLPLSSNPVTITVPGTASQYVWVASPGASQYVAPIELLNGTQGSSVRLPYVPNSMLMDRAGNNLYFGSARELMSYTTSTNSLGAQSAAAPGVVLAVAPDNSKVLVNDQALHMFYLYTTSGGTVQSFPGMGNAASWTPDGQTLYITDNAELNSPSSCPNITGHSDKLYVYNPNTGWATYPLPASPLPPSRIPTCSAVANEAQPTLDNGTWTPGSLDQSPAVMVPSVGAYLRGTQTQVHTWCPSGTAGNNSAIEFYPEGDNGNPTPVESDALAATDDGEHILGAEWLSSGALTLSDIAVSVPTTTDKSTGIATPDPCGVTTNTTTGVQTLEPLIINPTNYTQTPVSGVSAIGVNQVVTGSTPTPASGGAGENLAFITYSGTSAGAQLPYYLPSTGAVGYVSLTGGSQITAPIVGAFSQDNTIFFVSTAGDNLLHYINIPNAITSSQQPTDAQQIDPKLPACTPTSAGGTDAGCTYTGTGATVPATAIAVKPRSVT